MTKEQDFKQSLTAVLADLHQGGAQDGEAMWLLGSLASDLAYDLKASSWTNLKKSISVETYNGLLKTFRDQGNQHHREGRTKAAYAIQALVMSLISRTQMQDPQVVETAALLDELIDRATVLYRKQKAGAN